jgi:D-alanyl-D-alanine carboxypeptidase
MTPSRAVFFIFMTALAGCTHANLVPQTTLTSALAQDLSGYLAARGAAEHISAASLSLSLHGQPSTIDVAAGTTTFGGSTPVTPANLFEIGSNTKAFTAVILLQLEAENKLTINQTVGQWLPQYPSWKDVTIKQLLSMTSGIATYDATPAWEHDYSSAPTTFFSAPQLIAYVDQSTPLQPGWLYSNTGYELAQLIIEKVTGNSYATELQNRVITPLGLHSTYYDANIYPASVQDQMVSGYFDNAGPGNEGLAPLLGRDQKPFSVSWAQAAGGIVCSPSDLTRWVRALYLGPVLASAQRSELESLVSQSTGAPIAQVSASNPRGFGLGVAQVFQPAVGGAVWFYEGETLGYRVLHLYFPAQDAVLVIGLNSQPTDDQVGQLLTTVYQTLVAYGQL